MRHAILVLMILAMFATLVMPALGQPPAAGLEPGPLADGPGFPPPDAVTEEPEYPAHMRERVEQYRDMGMDEKEAVFFALLGSEDIDSSQLMMLMMMMDGGGMDDAFGMMMLMDGMGKGQPQPQPVVIESGNLLLIIEKGTLYVINLQTMEVTDTLAYAKKGDALASILPWLMMGRAEVAEVQELTDVQEVDEDLMDMKQLSLAALMYAEDRNETLPGEKWAEDIFIYVKDREMFIRADQPVFGVGYAMNEKLPLAHLNNITNPAETVLFFESNLGGDNPLGGADDVPEEGLHDGMIWVGYVDGHVAAVTPETARDLLERDPFE